MLTAEQVPSPNVAEDHQSANARAMAHNGAALLLPESQLSPQELQYVVTTLLGKSIPPSYLRLCVVYVKGGLKYPGHPLIR